MTDPQTPPDGGKPLPVTEPLPLATQILHEQRFRLLVQGIAEYAVFLLDPDGRLVSWNTGAERLFGYREDEILGRDDSVFFTPEDIRDGVPAHERATAARDGVARDGRWHLRKDGSRFWCNGTITALRHDDGSLVGFAKVMGDLTQEEARKELRRLGEVVEREARRKDEFLAMLAHELRNPLAPIRNALELLKVGDLDRVSADRAWDIIATQVGHLARLVDDLLDVARTTTGKIALRDEPVELAEVVNRAVETARPHIDGKRHTLSISLPPGPVLMRADAVRLAQVLANLLNNAAKYTDEGGTITLACEREGEVISIRVEDTGIGIAPEILPRIFDLFAQADRSLDRSQGGLGIGLTLARKLVEMHGGTVEARSDGAGRGSEFVVRLPVLRSGTRDMPSAWNRSPTRPLRALVVDDNTDAALTLARLLRMLWGHEVEVAHDGPGAIEVAVRFRPELVLLDIGLPGMDGYEVARRLRRRDGSGGMVIVALTGYGREEDRRRSREAGCDEHLVKPAEAATLESLCGHPKLRRAAGAGG